MITRTKAKERSGKEEPCVSENNGGNQARRDKSERRMRAVIFKESGSRSVKA